jgi:hypothetical protein
VEPPRRLALSRRWRGSLDPGNPPSHTARPPSHPGATLDPGWCSSAATAPLIQGGGSPRRRHEGSLPRAEIGGPSARRGHARQPGPAGQGRLPIRTPAPLAPGRPSNAPGGAFPGAVPLPQMGSPSRPRSLGRPGDFLREEASPPGASSRSSYSGASRAGMASARRPPLLPHPAPNGS